VVQEVVRIDSNREIAEGLFLLRFTSEQIAVHAQPGQFVNVRTVLGWSPLLLRRPFSISRVIGTTIEILFGIVGAGTRVLASKNAGEEIDVLGPLGTPFKIDNATGTAVIVGGGLGIAPFPFLTDSLEKNKSTKIITFIGSRSTFHVEQLHLRKPIFATDDGSTGFKGTVVDCLADYRRTHSLEKPKIFGCGPTKMLAALSAFAQANNLACELSLEGDMACGIGICQGCPVERNGGKKKYALVCTEGPTFDSRDITLRSA
jgi:dihydroorotate dehydrogenase electron transfer subunit